MLETELCPGEIKIAVVNAASTRTDKELSIVASLVDADTTATAAITDNNELIQIGCSNTN